MSIMYCFHLVSLKDPEMPGWSEIANDTVVSEKVCEMHLSRHVCVAAMVVLMTVTYCSVILCDVYMYDTPPPHPAGQHCCIDIYNVALCTSSDLIRATMSLCSRSHALGNIRQFTLRLMVCCRSW